MKDALVEKLQDFKDWLKDLRWRISHRKEFVDPNLRMRRKVLRDRIMTSKNEQDNRILEDITGFMFGILLIWSVLMVASMVVIKIVGVETSFSLVTVLPCGLWSVSLLCAIAYSIVRDHKYYIADFPEQLNLSCILLLLISFWPAVLVSYICLCRTRRQVYYEDYLQIREQQRRETYLAKLSDEERFSTEAEEQIRERDREQFLHQETCDRERLGRNIANDRAEVLELQRSLRSRCATIRQWQRALCEQPESELNHEYLKQNIARDRAEVVKLQKRLRFRCKTIRQWQHALTVRDDLDPKIIQNIEAGAGRLRKLPEVVKISYIHNRIMIELQITYVDKISRRLLGDFIIEVTPSEIICEPLSFGLRANARRKFPYLVSEEFLAEIISRNSVRDGFTLGFVQGFIDEFRQEIERYIPREDFYRYFVPIIETQKNAEL